MRFFGIDIFSKKRKKRSSQAGSLQGYVLSQLQGGGVSDKNAQAVTAFFAAIRVLSSGLSSMPLQVVELDDFGNITPRPRHYLTRLLKRPSQLYNGVDFIKVLQSHLMVYGNAYAVVIRDERAAPAQLRIIHPQNVDVYLEQDQQAVYYSLSDDNGNRLANVISADIIHLKGYSSDGIVGKPVWKIAPDIFRTGFATQQHIAEFFENGTLLNGYLTTPESLTKEQLEILEEAWRRRYSGPAGSTRTPVLAGGLEYKKIALSPDEAGAVKIRQQNIDDISRLTGVPVYMLANLERATFNNIEVLARDYVNNTLRPVAVGWERELSEKLIPVRQRDMLEFKFDFSSLLRADTDALAKLIATGMDKGVLSVNDARRMLGLNTVNESWASTHYMQLNMTSIQNINSSDDQ